WHAGDIEIIPEQKARAGIARLRNHVAAWHLDDDVFVQLANELTEDVTLSDGSHAIGLDRQPYDRIRMFGPEYRDLYAIDIRTGERERFAERVQYQFGVSPGGRYMLYVRDGDFWTYDTRTGERTNITAAVPTSFVDVEDDHTVPEKPMFGTGGWTTDDRSVLLYDKYDIWEVRPDGSRAVNLTNGAAERIRHRRMWLRPDHNVVDLSADVYVSLYGDTTKQSGYGRLRAGRPVERLVFLDRSVTRLGKAEDADVYAWRVEGFDDSPDYFVAGPALDGVQVTRTNPFQAEYAWGRSELIDFTTTTGRDLQAALLYPAGYEPGRTYPMIVFFYEITSNTVHSYTAPSAETPYNPTVFTQNGYFVLRPDIVYRDRNPGLSAVEALVPAVEKAIGTGMIDADRVGIIGHSWGAYQTAFTITQTDMFAAAVAGAPLTNLISKYLSIFWNSGSTDARIFEIQQGRMGVPFWEDTESYIANSPVFHIEQMDTPLLVAFGTEDGAVEFNQGVELYNAARRADKQMVMLVYEGENHSLSKEPNKKDYHRRIMEWFGHYLKGEPAPKWIIEGERFRQ
ncbi:MAG: prolyl oligopeptidase family serine peptidase, partial [Gemmatimonadota bacterium]